MGLAEDVQLAATLVAAAQRVVVLTGAGISTDSGIPDFRGPNGVWTKNPAAEKMATLQNYVADPEVRKAAWQNRLHSPNWKAQPNRGHRALAAFEATGRLHMLITQNVDGLHQAAGSDPTNVVEIHGTVREVVCLACDERAPMERALARVEAGEDDPPCRSCGGILKSATISFGQSLVMEDLARDLLPLASPMMDELHQRFLQHFVEQDVIGHMESDEENEQLDLGRLRVAIAFVDLAGYTRLTEEEGEEAAVDLVERFVDAVEATLPDDARVVKTIGDEAMIVGSDPTRLTHWALGFQMLMDERPLPRIGIHFGQTLYRDGDYYGREVNTAARVVARAAGGEVLVTRAVVDAVSGDLEFEPIGEVRLKGFSVPTELFVAATADGA